MRLENVSRLYRTKLHLSYFLVIHVSSCPSTAWCTVHLASVHAFKDEGKYVLQLTWITISAFPPLTRVHTGT